MKEVYRIKKGKLTCSNHTIPFYFGIVFEEEGYLFLDIYVEESFDLKSFMENDDNSNLRYTFSLNALTEANNELEVTELSFRRIIPHQSKIKMQSYGYMKHRKINTYYSKTADGQQEVKSNDKRHKLYYLELEGLKMEHCDLTETIRARKGMKTKDINNRERDHTEVLLIYDSPTNTGRNDFLFTFHQSNENDNVIVSLPNHQNEVSGILGYDKFLEFSREFIYLLSFLNGAKVAIRKEYTGGFYQIEKVDSQTTITYSFKSIRNERHNSYVPINDPFYRGSNLLNKVFINCFNKYVTVNKKLDLNTIIFYLNGAEQANSIEENFFIQIIALERLAQMYIETLNESETYVVPETKFQDVKKELLRVISKNDILSEPEKEALRSKIGYLHKAVGSKQKFIKLLEFAGIDESTPRIKSIINKVRNKSIHRGEIGDGHEGVRNHLILDQLLRDIILNIIGYDGIRNSKLN